MIYISLSSKSLKVALWLSIFIVCSVQNLNAQCQALPVTNLVTNGSFSAANTGFISGYRNCTDPNCLYPEGRYSIGRTADYFHDNFVGRDHTTGSGNFMIINGAGAPNTIVWSQKITVKPGVNYNFSSWVSSLNVRSPAKLQFQINGQTIGDIFSAPANLRNWQEFFVTWNSGTADTARITILNQNNDLGGNDFGLDDISFKEICPTKQPLLGPDISICGMGTLDLSSNIVATPTTTITWSNNTSGTGVTAPTKINITQPGIYWVCVQDGSCFKSDSIIVTAGFKVDLGPDLILCKQSSFLLDSDHENAYTKYKWYKNDLLIKDSTRRSLLVTSPGKYRVEVTDPSCNITESDEVNVTSQAAIPTDMSFCPPKQAVFKVAANPTGGFKWYDKITDGGVMGKGDSLKLTLATSKTLYAEDTTAFSYAVGAKSMFKDGTISSTHNGYFSFDAYESFTLKSVTVFAKVWDKDAKIKAGVTLRNSAGALIDHRIVDLTGPPIVPADNTWPFTVNIDLPIPKGNDLRLSSEGSTTQFFFAQGGTNSIGWDSYQVPSIIKIKGIDLENTWPRPDCKCYGVFYNWEIQKGTTCARTPVTAHYNCPLPLQWLSVAALRQSAEVVHLEWSTAHAESANKFRLERSTDGINFEQIGTAEAKNGINDYSFNDQHAAVDARLYYRISEIDGAGSVLSSSRVVTVKEEHSTYKVYPIPAENLLNLKTSSGYITRVELYNIQGFLVKSQRGTESEEVSVDVADLTSGSYLVKIYTVDDVHVQTFIKN